MEQSMFFYYLHTNYAKINLVFCYNKTEKGAFSSLDRQQTCSKLPLLLMVWWMYSSLLCPTLQIVHNFNGKKLASPDTCWYLLQSMRKSQNNSTRVINAVQ